MTGRKKETPPDPQKAKKKSKSDVDLWRHVTEDVEPLPRSAKNWHVEKAGETEPKARAGDAKGPPPPIPAPQRKRPKKPENVGIPGAAPLPPPPTLSHGTTAGLDKRTAERMKKGALKIEARLDLHGHTQEEARTSLEHFITAAHAQGKRQVLVITGKGGRGAHAGVLKDRVPQWLNGPPLRGHIVAFDYAAPKDGGSGALYVRLRKPRDT